MNLITANNTTSKITCDISTAIPIPTCMGRNKGLKIESKGLKILSKKLNVFR
jgi:hypothetical protein